MLLRDRGLEDTSVLRHTGLQDLHLLLLGKPFGLIALRGHFPLHKLVGVVRHKVGGHDAKTLGVVGDLVCGRKIR